MSWKERYTKMKKLLTAILVSSLVLGLTACAGNKPAEAPASDKATTTQAPAAKGEAGQAKQEAGEVDPQKDPRTALKNMIADIEGNATYQSLTESLSEEGKKALPEFQAELAKAKQAAEDEKATPEQLLGFLDYKKDGKKVKGSLHKKLHDVTLDLEVEGEPTVKNIHTQKQYHQLQENQVTVKSRVVDFEKHLKVTSVTKAAYEKFPAAADTASHPTPRYDRETLDPKYYTVEKVGENTYRLTFKDLPEDLYLVKPVLVMKIGGEQKVENGKLVYVN